jgi:tRNA nucleotidyltransferase/poly(A) polymerase
MLRGARLAAKLGITIEKKTAAPIPELAPLLENVPPARMFDEMEKLLLSGHAVESIKSLRRHGLHHGVLPLLDVILEQPLGQRFIELALANTDERIRDGKSATPAFMFATLLWHEVLATWNASKAKGERPMPALFDAMDRVLEQQAKRLAIPRRFEATIKETWALQPAPVSSARASPLSRRLRFPVAALRQRRDGRRACHARRLVGPLPACRHGRAREYAAARGSAEKAQARAWAQAQGDRCNRGAWRDRRNKR